MRRVYLIFLILPATVLSSPDFSEANDLSVEKSLQASLQRSRAIIEKAKERLRQGGSITTEITELKTLYEEVKASHLCPEQYLS